eukprot:scaffold3930_cov138-Skeletonema_dohrnii-CCMP3373.AAC.3
MRNICHGHYHGHDVETISEEKGERLKWESVGSLGEALARELPDLGFFLPKMRTLHDPRCILLAELNAQQCKE